MVLLLREGIDFVEFHFAREQAKIILVKDKLLYRNPDSYRDRHRLAFFNDCVFGDCVSSGQVAVPK
jgi:hypothetical protein